MRKTTYLGLLTAGLSLSLVACNNDDANTTANTGDTSTTPTTTDVNTTTTDNTTASGSGMNTVDYRAMADTFQTNSAAGVYLDPRTGKSIKIRVDTATGRRYNVATNKPVWRYVDNRNWWVYGGDSWEKQGEAKWENKKMTFKSDAGEWVDYTNRYPNDETEMKAWETNVNGVKTEMEADGDTKVKDANMKIKTEKDGDVKIKMEDGTKIKKDEDGTRVKKKD